MLIVTANANYDKGRSVSPIMKLNRGDYSLGTYSMRAPTDYSGRGNDLQGNTIFDSVGLVCTPTGGPINTGIMETDEFSICVCLNLSVGAQLGNIVSNLSPETAPLTGFRLLQKPDNSGLYEVATGIATAGQTLNSHEIGGTTGGYTRYMITVKAGEMAVRRASSYTPWTTTNRAKGAQPLFINGAPPNAPVAVGTIGVTGRIVAMSVYNKVFDATEQVAILADMKSVAAAYGIIVP